MILVNRSRAPNPLDPSTKLGEAAIAEIDRIRQELESGEARQRRLVFKVYRDKRVREALEELFHGKCAYCETSISANQPIEIDQFRPKGGVTEAPNHPGYWWLANSWDNLLAACIDCNRQRNHLSKMEPSVQTSGKGNRFPLVDEAQRACSPSDDIGREQPLLLNPTMDEPSNHLVFDADGMVHSDTERGNATIAVLGLNRVGLVQARQRVMTTFKALAEPFMAGRDTSDENLDRLMKMAEDDAPYAGMIRQALSREEEMRALLDSLEAVAPARKPGKVTKSRLKRAKAESKSYTSRMSDYSLDTQEGRQKFKSQQRFIERMTIHNIRAIRDLEIDFGQQSHGPTPWLMLLGENGTGKSTVLQAIALVVSGHDQVHNLLKSGRLDPATLVRYRCQSGRVTVKLSGFPKPHELIVYRDRLEFHSPHGQVMTLTADGSASGEGWEAQTLVLGYGATCLLPRKERSETGEKFSRVENLFDAFVPLIDAQTWLMGLDGKTFDETAIVLKDLLALDEASELIRDQGQVWVRDGNSKTALKDLSDGYQTIVAVTVDLLEVLSRIWPNLTEAEGVVLIDEIDAHLHPTWQMEIVGSLRKALPGVQYITTTHQPLCLRGLTRGEVVVMQRGEDGLVEPLTDLPSPEDFRVDQLLTSDFFGLRSTVDPEVEALFDTYYALLALDTRTPEQEAELARLQDELKDRRYLGNTQRETLFYEAIDAMLAKRKTGERRSPENLRSEAVEQVSSMWKQVLAEEEGGKPL
ncbi:AAA family ATPase [Leisingera thetidis]|uniref:AAA family ATPase n=1 Tax=Leisingera thetidis TaxID=2930199 RepID=UPI0021F7471C|nr:AAA family ATPase [Leisingera thetidis]